MTTTTFKNEDLKFVPAGTICIKCYKKINRGILRNGYGISFFCKECYVEDKNRLEQLIKNGH